MQFLKRSSSNTLKRYTSETMIHNRTNSRLQQVYSPASHTPIYKHNQPQPSILANLFPTKPTTNLKKVTGKLQRKSKQVLAETEERIFSEVLTLLSEIDQLRMKIGSTHEEVKEMSIAHPDIQERVAFHGYDQPLTREQCDQVEDENYRLERVIRQVEASQINGLQDVLRIERQKYEELKKDLNDNKMSNSANLQQRIKSLKASIAELQTQRHFKLKSTYPEFQDLKHQNDLLRQRTIANLIHSKSLREQEQALHQFLMNDELNRQEFMRELQSWKDNYKKAKAENEALKLKLLRKEKLDSKENQNSNVYRSKTASNKMLGIESQIKRKQDRLSEYSTLIRRMQSLNK